MGSSESRNSERHGSSCRIQNLYLSYPGCLLQSLCHPYLAAFLFLDSETLGMTASHSVIAFHSVRNITSFLYPVISISRRFFRKVTEGPFWCKFCFLLVVHMQMISRFLGGGFQIGSDENGWSKILTLRLYKTLAFTIRKQKMPWLPLSERVLITSSIFMSLAVVIDVHQG